MLKKHKKEIRNLLTKWIDSAYSLADIEIEINRNKKEGYGDYTSTVAFSLNKILGKKPIEIATRLEEEAKEAETLIKFVVAPPGFINIHFPKEWKINLLKEIQKEDQPYSSKTVTTLIISKIDKELKEELNYIAYRTKWILEVFKEEGISPNTNSLKLEEINPLEKDLIDQLVDWIELVEEVGEGQQPKEEEISEHLKTIIHTFHKYHNSLQLRKLEDPQRNVVLNLFEAINRVISSPETE